MRPRLEGSSRDMVGMKRLVVAATIFAASIGAVVSDPARANTLTANFTFLNEQPNASGGNITFDLNANGTIKATLTSTVGDIFSFGFNSDKNFLDKTAIFPPSIPLFDTNGLPDYKSGFTCNGSCLTNSI